uniref:CCHC-type domain-containing protein n=1 Tax=Neogobius melanostomus TaxID=47308 RepID=A0A8C6TUW3_9GOBI
MDTTFIVVKFWTGRISDEDVELYLQRYCTIIQTVKPLDKYGIWYGIRKYKVQLKKNSKGLLIQIPNSISLGPYNGRIIYPGQQATCFICQSGDHQLRQCPYIKCWKCGQFGHKAKDCTHDAQCNLCNKSGHTFFTCPSSYIVLQALFTKQVKKGNF